MTNQRWQEILGTIKDSFEVSNHQTQDLPDGPGTVETIEFQSPAGKIKLEWVSQPLIIDRKSLGSKRIGSEKTIQYTYSDTEKVNKFIAYKFNDDTGEWQEMAVEKSSMFF